MDTLVLSGTLSRGSLGACDSDGGTSNVPFSLYPSQKGAAVSFEAKPNISSPSAYATLEGVGTGKTVTQGNTLFIATTVPMLFRVTTYVEGGPNLVAEEWISGLYIREFPSDHYLVLLEVKGTGKVHYVVAGNQ